MVSNYFELAWSKKDTLPVSYENNLLPLLITWKSVVTYTLGA